MKSLDDLLAAVRTWREALSALRIPRVAPGAPAAKPVIAALERVERRVVEGADSPLRIALFGPTGAGKSKLFNSLAGELVSPASFHRPFTRRPVYRVHERHRDLAGSLDGEVRLHGGQDGEDLVLIDSPDFDSVEEENRDFAGRVYLEADAFIFVTDVHKYADAATWTYIERIRAEGKRAVFVLNKAPAGSREGVALEDFRARLAAAFAPGAPPGPVVAVAERAQGDDDLLPPGEPGLVSLRGALEALRSGGGGGLSLREESFRIDLDRLLSAWDDFAGPLTRYRAGLEGLRREADRAYQAEARDLEKDLQAEVDPALKGEVYREVLRRIERIDVLRYPRRILGLPVRGLRIALEHLRARFRRGEKDAAPASTAGDIANLAALQVRALGLAERFRAALRAEPDCPGLLDGEGARGLRVDRASLEGRYREAAATFRSWAEERARSTASALTAEHKVKFILSQVIYNTVVIGVQVKTAGTLTLTEMFTDGILSPLVAKAVGMAVSSERVAEFEDEARREFTRRLVEILAAERDGFASRLTEEAAGLEPLAAVAPGLERLRATRDALVARYGKART